MKNNKGFSLLEVMTVVIILGILASLSIPYVIGYVRDARNDRAKSVLNMIAQGYKNFRVDFSQYTIDNAGPIIQLTEADGFENHVNFNGCNVALTNNDNEVGFDFLIMCSYLQNLDYAALRYNFYLGGAACNDCGGTANDLACMIGNEANGTDYDNRYCAYIDRDNNLHEERIITE